MPGRIALLAALVASLTWAGVTQGSERHVIIAGAAVGALIGGSIAVQAHHGRVPVYIEIGPAPGYYPGYPRYYVPAPHHYQPYPRYHRPQPNHYRPYPLRIAPRHLYRPHPHRHHQRHQPRAYAPRW